MGKEARNRFNAGELNINQIKLLEELPEWTWNPLDDEWNHNYLKLVDFAEQHGHTRPLRSQTSLGSWTSSQRSAYRKGKLSLKESKVRRYFRMELECTGPGLARNVRKTKRLYLSEQVTSQG